MTDILTENSIFFEILGGTWRKKDPHFGRIWPKNNICWKNFSITFWHFTWRKYPENLTFIPPFAEELSPPPVFAPQIRTACVLAPHVILQKRPLNFGFLVPFVCTGVALSFCWDCCSDFAKLICFSLDRICKLDESKKLCSVFSTNAGMRISEFDFATLDVGTHEDCCPRSLFWQSLVDLNPPVPGLVLAACVRSALH